MVRTYWLYLSRLRPLLRSLQTFRMLPDANTCCCTKPFNVLQTMKCGTPARIPSALETCYT